MSRKTRLVSVATVALVAGCAKQWPVRAVDPELRVEADASRIERGAYLVGTIGACGVCHNGRPEGDFTDNFERFDSLLGGTVFVDSAKPDKFRLWMPNITSHETGIGTWSDDEVMRAIRDGARPDGDRLFPMMPYVQYEHLSDEDTRAIVAFLRTTPPVESQGDRADNKIPWIFRAVTAGLGHEPATSVPEPDRADPVAYGAYLAQVGHCGACHSMGMKYRGPEHDKWLSGSAMALKEPWGSYQAPNLTPDEETGLGRYSAEQIKDALRNRQRLDGEMMMPPMSTFARFYGNMTEEDLDALVAYLKSLPPVKGKVLPRKLTERGVAYAEAARRELGDARRETDSVDAEEGSP